MSGSDSDGDVVGFRRLNAEKHSIDDDEKEKPAEFETSKITCESPNDDNRPFARVKICGEEIEGLMDSGASITILGQGGYELVERLKLEKKTTAANVTTADGTRQWVSHYVIIPFEFLGKVISIRTLLVETIQRKLILGIDFWRAFNIAPCEEEEPIADPCDTVSDESEPEKTEIIFEEHELSREDRARLEFIKKTFPFVNENGPLSFTKLTKHTIDTADAKPIKQRQYVFSPYMQARIQKELERLLSRDIIEKVAAPTWLNPVRPVPKSDDKLRLCLDARKLNQVTVKNTYPQQNVNRILGRLEGTKFLTALDLTDAFYQVRLNKHSREKTAFAIPGVGTFMYKRMPMGLVNSGATLCELVDRLFGAEFEPECFPYLDDFIIATDSLEKHLKILQRVSEKLNESGLVISAKKSKFCMKRLKYLGHVIDERGIRPDPEKVAPIKEYPAPEDVKGVRRFIGLAGWYRRFIPNFSSLSAPITDLIKSKTKKFSWTKEAQDAFEKIKIALATSPILATPDYTQPFEIQTDASDVGIGGVLTQKLDGAEKIIAYMSTKLTRQQQKYHVTERECLAVLMAIEKFRPYIEGVKFTVITDHASLLWLQNLKDPAGRLARWALRMQAFDFDLKHRKGKFNVVPDAMSRAIKVDLLKVARSFVTVDPWYNKIREAMKKNQTAKSGYMWDDENLWYYVKKGKNAAQIGWKVCVPRELMEEIISKNHDALTSSHGGIFRTLCRIKEVYFWPKMEEDVTEYVNQCTVCKKVKASNKNQNAPMGEYRDSKEPFRMLALDYMGPLPTSKKGNRFILVVIDVFSKFVFIKPLRLQSAKHTVDYLKNEVFLRFGVPEVVISDNGPQLRSDAFKAFLETYKVKHWLTASYHPQANPTEAVNKTIITAIRAYIKDDVPHDTWDEHIAEITYALNSSTHSTTKASPNLVVFGKRLPEDGQEFAEKEEDWQIQPKLKIVREKVTAYLKAAYESNKMRYDLRTRDIEYSPGETVYRRNNKLSDGPKKYSAKLADKFVKGEIIRRVGTNTYEVKDCDTRHIGIYHTQLLKK